MKNNSASVRWLLTLTWINTVILCITGYPTVFTDPIPRTFLSVSFYSVAYIAQNFLFACLLSVILLPIFLWVRSDRLKIILSVIPVFILQLVCFMNAKVFSFWRLHINGSLLRMYFSKGGGSQVFEVNISMYIWIFCAILVFLVLSIVTIFVSRSLRHYFNLKRWLGLSLVIYVIAQSAFIILGVQNNIRVLEYTMKIPYFYDLSWARGLQKMHVTIFPKDSTAAKLHAILSVNKPLDYPLHPLQYHPPQHPLNVLLIVIDTLRYDMVNPINMPNVTRFAQHANQFQDNMSGGDCTRPGIFSLFYGIPANYWESAISHHHGSILIRAFQANHYQLGLFASAPLLSPPFDQTVFVTVKNLQTITPGATPMLRDVKITHQMQHFLNHAAVNHKPFFAFMFYDAPHAYNEIAARRPFHPVGFLNYFNVSNSTPRIPIFNLYKNAVLADDHLVQEILTTVKKDHLSKNTVVIITADHGQEFNDDHNNYWEHASGFSKYQMHTPMIIAWPNRAPKIFRDETSHFDLVPTLLKRVLGVSNPTSDYSVGTDFFSKKQANFVIAGNYAYLALITQHRIMQFHESGLYRFTDFKMHPLSAAKTTPLDLSRLEREMTAFRSTE